MYYIETIKSVLYLRLWTLILNCKYFYWNK